MATLAHYRILGYVVTLAMHAGNTIATKMALRGEIMNDPEIKNLASMENCYYTVWNIAFQMLYATFGLYCDVKSLNNGFREDKTLFKYRTSFFAIVWSSTWFVFTMFWPIFLYDRNLIFPDFIDRVFPKYSNYIMHGTILPVVLWEMMFLPRHVPRSHKKNVACIHVIYIVYLAWIIHVNSNRGLWPYPMLYSFEGTIYFPIFFLVVYVLMHLHYFTQWIIVRYLWRNIRDNVKSS